MRFILGFVLAIVGVAMVIKTEPLYEFFGPIPFAEKYISTEGGSRLLYKLIGIAITLVGFLLITGLHVSFINWIAVNFFGALVPQAPK